jgi:hypothetical protein
MCRIDQMIDVLYQSRNISMAVPGGKCRVSHFSSFAVDQLSLTLSFKNAHSGPQCPGGIDHGSQAFKRVEKDPRGKRLDGCA